MIQTIWQILPIALGVIASPIAVLAVLGIMLSDHPRRNATAYTAGWILAVAALLLLWVWLLGSLGVQPDGPGSVARALHLIVALVCFGGSLFVYRRARGTLERLAAARTPAELVAAAPQLPGLLRTTEHYTPARSFVLGATIFSLNPMNVSLVAATAIDLLASGLDPLHGTAVGAGFVLAAALPVLIPTLLLIIRGAAAEKPLRKLRTWVLHNNGFLSSSLLMLVGFMQLGRAFEGVLT